ncbi:MAG TPA: hypothetical protein EYP36_12035 [Calditrichaeota bacterium]|nr:hypothetical protein [Calditrichota bacterium]
MSWIKDVKSELARLDYGSKSLKHFGWLVGGILIILAAFFYYRRFSFTMIGLFFSAGFLLTVFSFTAPRQLKHVYKGWMALAFLLGWLMSRILLTLIFYAIITPLGIAAKLFGKQFLALKTDPKSKSYWVRREQADADYEKMY